MDTVPSMLYVMMTCYDDMVSGLTEQVDGLNVTDHGSGALKQLKSNGVFSIKLSSSFGTKIHTI